MMLLGNLGQQLDINDTQEALAELDRRLQAGNQFDRDTGNELRRLARENAELKLYLAAVIRLLATKNVITQSELAAIVDTIDRADGQPDGGYTGPLKDG